MAFGHRHAFERDWSSPDQIVDSFHLRANPQDLGEIRQELQRRMAVIHPDSSGGSFQSPADEEMFHKLTTAREYIEERLWSTSGLIPISQLPAIIRSLQAINAAPATATQASSFRAEYRADIGSRYWLPRIVSGTFAAVCIFFATFAKTFKDDPLLAGFVTNRWVRLALLVGAVYSAVFFVFTWIAERREEETFDFALSAAGRRTLFQNNLSPGFTFSDSEVVNAVQAKFACRVGHRFFFFFGGRSLRPSAVDKIAKVHLSELLERGAIRKVKSLGLDVIYEVTPDQ